MRIKVIIDTDNAAFEDSPHIEVARILRGLANKLSNRDLDELPVTLMDINGNSVGRAFVVNGEDQHDE